MAAEVAAEVGGPYAAAFGGPAVDGVGGAATSKAGEQAFAEPGAEAWAGCGPPAWPSEDSAAPALAALLVLAARDSVYASVADLTQALGAPRPAYVPLQRRPPEFRPVITGSLPLDIHRSSGSLRCNGDTRYGGYTLFYGQGASRPGSS